jgi:hypothetical protein
MKLEIVLHAKSVDIEEAATATIAIEKQLREHVAPAWERVSPTVVLARGEDPRDPEAFPIVIFDDAEQAGYLGFHDLGPDGRPFGKVFAKTAREFGGNWVVTLSHEAIEMFLDPDCTLWAVGTDGRLHAMEGADAVEADEYPVEVGDTTVQCSNFVLPSYFSTNPRPGARFDYLGRLSAPSPAKTSGGYSIDADIGNEGQSFADRVRALFGDLLPDWKRAAKEHPGSRTSRRSANRSVQE